MAHRWAVKNEGSGMGKYRLIEGLFGHDRPNRAVMAAPRRFQGGLEGGGKQQAPP